MKNGNGLHPIHSLIPLADFKTILGIDDREDALSRYCLVTATYTIEHYCKRLLLHAKGHEILIFYGDYCFPLGEYPVREILTVHGTQGGTVLLEDDFYHTIPDCGTNEDVPFSLVVNPAVKLPLGGTLKAVYWAGYPLGKVPADLASACLELAAWNMARYRGRRIGMTGMARGAGNGGLRSGGEDLESSMPENVRGLLEPYKRVTL
jgi:hypothetical protein